MQICFLYNYKIIGDDKIALLSKQELKTKCCFDLLNIIFCYIGVKTF